MTGLTLAAALEPATLVLFALGALAAAAWLLRGRRARRALGGRDPLPGPRRVLFPFLGHALSKPALEAALRLARAEGATLVPVYLAQVPLHLPLDTPLPRQSDRALTLLEAVEQRAHRCGIPVDARIERGRDPRHALRQLLDHERYDRIVLPAATDGDDGFTPTQTAWLLANAPGEIVVLRPGRERHDTERQSDYHRVRRSVASAHRSQPTHGQRSRGAGKEVPSWQP
jgi:nucleotide-binding universal stress UspA family protein